MIDVHGATDVAVHAPHSAACHRLQRGAHVIQVDRALFLPQVMWPYDMRTRASTTVDRRVDPDAWYGYADADVPIATQWDDGQHHSTAPGKVPTSSAFAPTVVAAMLTALHAHSGTRVLEIGTGTGWNAALKGQPPASRVPNLTGQYT
jgi:protein-L-isoaspartate O-methyltransferase